MSNEQPSLRATRTAASHDARTVTPDERAGALEFLQGLSKEMSAGKVNLPCFPDVVVRIRRALANPETHIARTVQIVGTEVTDGRVDVEIRTYSPDQIAHQLAGFGASVEVVGPPEIRDHLARIATELARLYRA